MMASAQFKGYYQSFLCQQHVCVQPYVQSCLYVINTCTSVLQPLMSSHAHMSRAPAQASCYLSPWLHVCICRLHIFSQTGPKKQGSGQPKSQFIHHWASCYGITYQARLCSQRLHHSRGRSRILERGVSFSILSTSMCKHALLGGSGGVPPRNFLKNGPFCDTFWRVFRYY